MHFALYKRKGGKSWAGAIPNKRHLSKIQFRKALRLKLRKNYVFRLITGLQLKKYLRLKLNSKVSGDL